MSSGRDLAGRYALISVRLVGSGRPASSYPVPSLHSSPLGLRCSTPFSSTKLKRPRPDIPTQTWKKRWRVTARSRPRPRKGVFVEANQLMPPATATSVRVRAGSGNVTDGPFAETKELLIGYYVLDCRHLDGHVLVPEAPRVDIGGE